MTKVYVDHNGNLWMLRLILSPFGTAWVYEHSGDQHAFVDASDADRFREMLGMELLGEL